MNFLNSFPAILRLEQKKSKFIKMAVPFLARFVRLLGIKPHDDGDKLPPMENALEEILCFLKPFVEGLSAAAQYPLASQVIKVVPSVDEGQLPCYFSGFLIYRIIRPNLSP